MHLPQGKASYAITATFTSEGLEPSAYSLAPQPTTGLEPASGTSLHHDFQLSAYRSAGCSDSITSLNGVWRGNRTLGG